MKIMFCWAGLLVFLFYLLVAEAHTVLNIAQSVGQ